MSNSPYPYKSNHHMRDESLCGIDMKFMGLTAANPLPLISLRWTVGGEVRNHRPASLHFHLPPPPAHGDTPLPPNIPSHPTLTHTTHTPTHTHNSSAHPPPLYQKNQCQDLDCLLCFNTLQPVSKHTHPRSTKLLVYKLNPLSPQTSCLFFSNPQHLHSLTLPTFVTSQHSTHFSVVNLHTTSYAYFLLQKPTKPHLIIKMRASTIFVAVAALAAGASAIPTGKFD